MLVSPISRLILFNINIQRNYSDQVSLHIISFHSFLIFAENAPTGSLASVGVEMSQLFLRTNAPNQNARVYLGRGENSFSVGLNSQGAFSVATTQGTSSTPGDSKADKDLFVVTKDHVVASNIVARSANVKLLSINNVVQWQGLKDIFFTEVPAEWTKNPITNCNGVSFIGIDEANTVIKGLVKDLPAYSQIRIVATGHFVDDWQGETAYMKVNGNYVWTDSHELRTGAAGINVCGSDRFFETKFTVPIDITLPNVGNSLNFEIGSTIESGSTAKFGLSSISISIRP